MESTVNIKDFIIDIDKENCKIETTKRSTSIKPKAQFSVYYENNTDFIINRKTARTEYEFVFLVSQNLYYITDKKTNLHASITERRQIDTFFKDCDEPIKFEKVFWIAGGSFTCNKDSAFMISIIYNDSIVDMLKHNINLQSYIAYKDIASSYPDDSKLLFKLLEKLDKKIVMQRNEYFSNKVIYIKEFIGLLRLLESTSKEISYDDAMYFLDSYNKSNLTLGNYPPSSSEIIIMIKKYNLNFKRFTDYIFSELYNQGIACFDEDVFRLYRDFLSMQMQVYNRVKEKYPKHLKTEHDIVSLKATIMEQLRKRNLVFENTEEQKSLLYSYGKYCILLPTCAIDIIDEGINQNHCVATYVDKVADKNCTILFMRLTKNKEESLITIEVIDNRITQVRGYLNRAATEEEKKFITLWAKNKKLIY